MKKILILFLAFGLVAASCNNNKDKGNPNTNNRQRDNYMNNEGDNNKDNNTSTGNWSPADKQRALKECMEGVGDQVDESSARNFCSCVLEKTMKKYPSYEKADAMATEAEGQAWSQECKAELTNNGNDNNNNNNGANWSRTDENRFMSDCEGTARQNVGAQRAREYCDCMLQKVKKIFSSYVEADRGLLQMPKEELDAMVNECNGIEN